MEHETYGQHLFWATVYKYTKDPWQEIWEKSALNLWRFSTWLVTEYLGITYIQTLYRPTNWPTYYGESLNEDVWLLQLSSFQLTKVLKKVEKWSTYYTREPQTHKAMNTEDMWKQKVGDDSSLWKLPYASIDCSF